MRYGFARVMVANTGLPVGGRDSNFLPDDAPLEADAVLFATGRMPNTVGLGLEAAGIEL